LYLYAEKEGRCGYEVYPSNLPCAEIKKTYCGCVIGYTMNNANPGKEENINKYNLFSSFSELAFLIYSRDRI
jgi:hypothetical protein